MSISTELIASIIIPVIQILIALGFFKYFSPIKIRDTHNAVMQLNTRLDDNEEELVKFKKEVRDKNEKLVEVIDDMEKSQQQENKVFTEILSRINLTLVKLDATTQNLNDTVKKNEEQVGKMIDRWHKEFDNLKEDVKEELRDLRRQ